MKENEVNLDVTNPTIIPVTPPTTPFPEPGRPNGGIGSAGPKPKPVDPKPVTPSK